MIHLQGDIGSEANAPISLIKLVSAYGSGQTAYSITSMGGSLYDGWAMHDFVRLNDGFESITGYGMVASAATIFMTAFKVRKGAPNSKYVIHNPQTIDAGDASKFLATSEELRIEEEKLINHYVSITGKSYEEIKNIMAEERLLTAQDALDLGLLTEIINFENMSEKSVTHKDLENSLDKLWGKITNFLKIKNMVVQSTDGTELEFDSDVEQPSQIAVGGGLKANGQPATGEFILADGTKVVAEGGKITEVTLAEEGGTEEVESLKAELEATKTQLTEAQNKVGELTNSIATAKNEVTAIKNELVTFKNKFSNYTPPANLPGNGGSQSKRR